MAKKCNSDQNAGGCTSSDLYSTVKKGSTILDKNIKTLNSKIDDLKKAITDCCDTTGDNLNDIFDLLKELHDNNGACCNAVNAKFVKIINVLKSVENCDGEFGSTTTGEPTPGCLNYLLTNTNRSREVLAIFYTVGCDYSQEWIMVANDTPKTGCYISVTSLTPPYGIATVIGECPEEVTSTTTCDGCTTTTEEVISGTTTEPVSRIFWFMNDIIGAELTINLAGNQVLLVNEESTLVHKNGVLENLSGDYEVKGRWHSGSQNVIRMRICSSDEGQLFIDDSITNNDPLAEYTIQGLPDGNDYYISITAGNVTPMGCPE
jgi:hypothetical protein